MNLCWRAIGWVLLALHLLAGVSGNPAGDSRQETQQQVHEEGKGATSQELPIQKRSLEEGSKEEMDILKDLILSHVVSEIENLREKQQEEDLKQQEDDQRQSSMKSSSTKDKRLFQPLTGSREDVPAIKRQIRYHQCYFNPISCFRRK